jgi:excisionase family DNA binding protein
MSSESYIRAKDVAEQLEVSYISVLNYIRRGQLLAIKRGGQWVISATELQRFKEEGNAHSESTRSEESK